MKKIMFNDKYGLTQTVLEGRKTQTRRIIKCPKTFNGTYVSGFRVLTNSLGEHFTYLVDEDEIELEGSCLKPAYKIGEEVAVAQPYKNIESKLPVSIYGNEFEQKQAYHIFGYNSGWHNKMFVVLTSCPTASRLPMSAWNVCKTSARRIV